jgi:ParB-like chromosome segregation protein Spo0J
MKILQILLEDLTLDPRNAREHNDKSLSALAVSLDRFGQRKPIVITSDNQVVAGNGTVQAAMQLGWEKVEAVRVPADWDSEKIKAFAIADNRTAELSDWNREILAEQLLELEESDFSPELLGFEPTPVADFLPVEDDVNPSLDERSQYECPHCTGLFEMVSGKPKAID